MKTFEERRAFANVNGYFAYGEYQLDGVNKWVAINPLLFTTALIGGRVETLDTSVEERWCYERQLQAVRALAAWKELGFVGEPKGWHRHPYSGRRRKLGEPSLEYIDP